MFNKTTQVQKHQHSTKQIPIQYRKFHLPLPATSEEEADNVVGVAERLGSLFVMVEIDRWVWVLQVSVDVGLGLFSLSKSKVVVLGGSLFVVSCLTVVAWWWWFGFGRSQLAWVRC